MCPGAGAESPGEPLWLKSYDTFEISDLAGDSAGNLLLARSGVETLKLDCRGERLWSKPWGTGVAVDAEDNVYVVGSGAQAAASAGASRPGAFVTKLDRDGAVVYVAALGGGEGAEPQSLAVTAAGTVAVSGAGLGTVELDGAGAVLWRSPFSGPVAFDSIGNLWLTGELLGERDVGTGTLSSRGGSDVWLLKLARDGAPLLARSFGDSGAAQRGEAIAVDADDNVVLTGTFDGSIDFGSAPLVLRPEHCSSDAWCLTDGFVVKLDAQANALWSLDLGPMRAAPGVAADAAGNVLVSGALPGGVRPFRQPRLMKLSGDGALLWQRSEWPDAGIGAGHAVTVDAGNDVVWSVSARPSLEREEQAYLAKLAP